MNDRDQESPTPKGPEVPADPIGTLLRISGRRPSISPQRSARAREAVRAHWEAQVEQGARRRRFWMRMALTTAATAVVAIGVGIWRQGTLSSIGRAVGQVEVVSSSAWSRSTSLLSTRAQASLQPGDEVTAGSELATGREGRAAIRLESGHSVRLDTETRLRILSDRTLALERGAVYVDSRNSLGPPDGAVEIRTSLGVVRDLGTQFEVRLTDASLRVKVREGEVSLDGRDQPRRRSARVRR